MGKQWKQCQTLFSGAPKSLQMVTAAMKLKDAYYLEESYDQPRQHIEKQRHYFANKGPSRQSYGFSSVMYGCESWTVKKAERQRIDAFEPWPSKKKEKASKFSDFCTFIFVIGYYKDGLPRWLSSKESAC